MKRPHGSDMEELTQNLIATLHESLLVLDLDLRVQVASRSFYGTFQVEREEVEDRYLYELGNGQWDIPPLRAALQEVVDHGTQFEDLAVEHHFPHIGAKVMLVNARRVEREAGAVPLILLAMDDVTEQRGDLPALDADPTQMRQLMQNLLDNGLKFHRAGEPPRVKIRSHSAASPEFVAPPLNQLNGEFCYISVQDNGIGFDEKYIDRIFSPFERLHTQNQYPGTGIGLAVCRRIIERHGGSLTAKSVPDQGTTFFMVLPLQQPQESPPQ